MTTTQTAHNIGKPDNAYALVALPSEKTALQISQLLIYLSRELGDSIWAVPNNALHITLCEIIQPKEYTSDKQLLYEQHADEYINTTAKILAEFKPIRVTFDTIEVSPQAIIVRGTDDGSFQNIRKELVDRLPLPGETKMPPDIIHSSIARFRKEIPLSDVEKVTKRYSIQVNEEVKEFRLIKNLVTPLLKYETVHAYSLDYR